MQSQCICVLRLHGITRQNNLQPVTHHAQLIVPHATPYRWYPYEMYVIRDAQSPVSTSGHARMPPLVVHTAQAAAGCAPMLEALEPAMIHRSVAQLREPGRRRRRPHRQDLRRTQHTAVAHRQRALKPCKHCPCRLDLGGSESRQPPLQPSLRCVPPSGEAAGHLPTTGRGGEGRGGGVTIGSASPWHSRNGVSRGSTAVPKHVGPCL